MTDYFEAADGHGESTIWRQSFGRPPAPVAVIRESDVSRPFWPDVVARMTGTTITSPGEREPDREEHNAVQGQWDGGEPGNAAPMPATTTATPAHAPLTGTIITADDATVELVARSLYEFKFSSERLPDPLPWDHPRMDEFVGDWVREQYRPQARAILAALTGAPSEPAHRHYYVDVSTFADADAGRHNWLCECGATDETRDRA